RALAAAAHPRRHGRGGGGRPGLPWRGRRLCRRARHRAALRVGRGERRQRHGLRGRRTPLRRSRCAARGARGDARWQPACTREGLALHAHGAGGRRPRQRAGRGGALMLLEIAQWLATDIRAFAVIQYITLRAVLAALTALAVGLILGPLVIRKLAQMKIGQAVRPDGPQTHLTKSGTPTMGGALIL